jgi:hypothetical protein
VIGDDEEKMEETIGNVFELDMKRVKRIEMGKTG